jgi:hypothetical protein
MGLARPGEHMKGIHGAQLDDSSGGALSDVKKGISHEA